MNYSTSSTASNTSYASTGYWQVFVYAPAPPRPQPLPPALVDQVWNAAAILDIDLPTNRKAIESARRQLAREHHPDVGGSLEAMQQINAAADFLLTGCQ